MGIASGARVTRQLLVRELVAVLAALSPPKGQPVLLTRPIPMKAWKALLVRGWLAQEGDGVWLTKAGRAKLTAARRQANRCVLIETW
jgi:hypothetical protein